MPNSRHENAPAKRYMLLDFAGVDRAGEYFPAIVAAAEKRGIKVQTAGNIGEPITDPFADLDDDDDLEDDDLDDL